MKAEFEEPLRHSSASKAVPFERLLQNAANESRLCFRCREEWVERVPCSCIFQDSLRKNAEDNGHSRTQEGLPFYPVTNISGNNFLKTYGNVLFGLFISNIQRRNMCL